MLVFFCFFGCLGHASPPTCINQDVGSSRYLCSQNFTYTCIRYFVCAPVLICAWFGFSLGDVQGSRFGGKGWRRARRWETFGVSRLLHSRLNGKRALKKSRAALSICYILPPPQEPRTKTSAQTKLRNGNHTSDHANRKTVRISARKRQFITQARFDNAKFSTGCAPVGLGSM